MIRARCAKLGLLASFSLASLACNDAERRERESAADVAHAEQVLRDVDNSAKAHVLPMLSKPCFGAAPCEAQRACRAAYALYVDGLALTRAAKQQLDDGKSTDAAKLLGSAEQKLSGASSQIADCTDRAAALRRQYAL